MAFDDKHVNHIIEAGEIDLETMPVWHRDVLPGSQVCCWGHMFEFYGIDPAKPNLMFLEYRGPSKQTMKKLQRKLKENLGKNPTEPTEETDATD